MPQDLVLFCKSYKRDFLRLKRLFVTLEKHNADSIPFYIATPAADKSLLFDVLKSHQGFHWVADEEIAGSNPYFNLERYLKMSGGLSQQIIKSEFWRIGIASNYLCIDSDSIFIRPDSNFKTFTGKVVAKNEFNHWYKRLSHYICTIFK